MCCLVPFNYFLALYVVHVFQLVHQRKVQFKSSSELLNDYQSPLKTLQVYLYFKIVLIILLPQN